LPFFHDQDPYHHFGILYAAYERAAAVLLLSPHTEALFRRYLPGARPFTIGAGVDTAPFTELAIDGRAFRAKYGLEGRRLMLFVGRKEPSKRYELAVEALQDLPRDVMLVMVGKDADGASLPERVLHLGQLDRTELVGAYDACDVFVLPSEHESFGMVVLEAWLRRKPTVGNSRCGAVSALIDDSVDGLLSSTAGELAAAINELLANPEKSRRLGEAGYAKVEREFTWDRVASRALAVYEEVARNTAGLRRSA
jgi:glycosyltransferase involved in cell wall biosynthesis